MRADPPRRRTTPTLFTFTAATIMVCGCAAATIMVCGCAAATIMVCGCTPSA